MTRRRLYFNTLFVPTLSMVAMLTGSLTSALVVQREAAADLSWFDVAGNDDRPHVSFAEVIAWSDACLAVTDAEWPAVERVYSVYIQSWEGLGKDEDKLWLGLNQVLGLERAGCIDAFRASTDAILRTRDASTRHIALRRELLGLASTRGQLAADAHRVTRELATRIAGAVYERGPNEFDEIPPTTEVASVRDAVLRVRDSIAGIIGEERADNMIANIVQAYELSGTTALSWEFRAIIEHSSRLEPEQRERIAVAYAAADAKLRGKSAYLTPREARFEADETLFKEVEAIIGVDRADLIRGLAGGYVDVNAHPEGNIRRANMPVTESINTASDALLSRFVLDADIPAVAGAVGRSFWRPLSHHGIKPKPVPEPCPISTAFLVAVAGTTSDDEIAIIESIQRDSAQRYAQAEQAFDLLMSKEARIGGIADMSIAEDERALAELQSAFGVERLPASTIALARLARLERTLPFTKLAARFDTLSRIPWPNGSVVSAALGERVPPVAPLAESKRVALRATLELAAETLLASRLSAWREVQAANVAFDRVLEQFAGVSRVARERLVAMQAARLAGLAACASAARRSYSETIALVQQLAAADKVFEAQYIALALLEQDLGRTDAGRRLELELGASASAELRDRALIALVPTDPTAESLLRVSSEAAVAAGNMDDGDLKRIEAGNVVLTALRLERQRLDRAMRAQVAVSWRQLRAAGDLMAADAFKP